MRMIVFETRGQIVERRASPIAMQICYVFSSHAAGFSRTISLILGFDHVEFAKMDSKQHTKQVEWEIIKMALVLGWVTACGLLKMLTGFEQFLR